MHVVQLNKQTAESKELADITENHNFSYQATLYCSNKVISAIMAEFGNS